MDSITDILNKMSTKVQREWRKMWYPCDENYKLFEMEKLYEHLEKNIKSIEERGSEGQNSEKKGLEDGSTTPDSQRKSGSGSTESSSTSTESSSSSTESSSSPTESSSSPTEKSSGSHDRKDAAKPVKTQNRMPETEGILVFTLWYLGIAYNYYMGETKLSGECSSSCAPSEAGDAGGEGGEGGEGEVAEVPVEEEPVIETEEPEPEPPPPPPPPPPADEAGGGDVEEEE